MYAKKGSKTRPSASTRRTNGFVSSAASTDSFTTSPVELETGKRSTSPPTLIAPEKSCTDNCGGRGPLAKSPSVGAVGGAGVTGSGSVIGSGGVIGSRVVIGSGGGGTSSENKKLAVFKEALFWKRATTPPFPNPLPAPFSSVSYTHLTLPTICSV